MTIEIILSPEEPSVSLKLLSGLAPHLLWATLVLVLVILIGPRQVGAAILNLRKIGFGGFEIEFRSAIAAAAAGKGVTVSPRLQDQLARRAEMLRPILAGSRLLWIDDNPGNNTLEISLLNRLGITIDLAKDDDTAQLQLALCVYDVVLSDMARGGVDNAGRLFLPRVTQAMLAPPLIFYVGREQDTPSGATGLTTRPDELIDLIFNALEKRKT